MRRLPVGGISTFDADDLPASYTHVLERRTDVFGTAARIVADPASPPALVHCSAGKDRRPVGGPRARVLGTPGDGMVEDYTLTGGLRPNRVGFYRRVFAEAAVDGEKVPSLFETPATAMQTTLEQFDRRHGGAAGYLIGAPASARTTSPRFRQTCSIDPPRPRSA